MTEVPNKKLKVVEEDDAFHGQKMLPDSINSDEHKHALKHEDLNEEEFNHHWEGCVKERIDDIRKWSVQDVLKKWNFYSQANGYKLVSIKQNCF